jgi:hypothetical protein
MKLNKLFEGLKKEIIKELKMGQAALDRILQRYEEDVLVGFEFECVVSAEDFGGAPAEVETMTVGEISSYSEFEDHFEPYGNVMRQIDRAYENWVDTKRDEYADENWEGYRDEAIENLDDEDASEEEIEETAKDLARDDFDENSVDRNEWIDDEYNGDYEIFISEFSPNPYYGWVEGEVDERFYTEPHDDEYIDDDVVYDEVKSNLEQHDIEYIGDVVGDSSIEGRDEEKGIEIVTEPIPLYDVADTLGHYLRWIRRNASTNSSTGLHINVSFDGRPSIDWLKVGLFFGERHVAEIFDRVNNNYAKGQISSALQTLINSNIEKQENFDKLIDELSGFISHDKYRVFNIGKYDDLGYVEFRVAGGADYEDKQRDILNTISRIVRVLALGADPQAARKEYMKKVAKLLSKSREIDAVDAKPGDEEHLEKLSQKYMGNKNAYYTDLFPFMYRLFNNKVKLTPQQRISLRKFAKKEGITRQSIEQFFDGPMDKLAFLDNAPEKKEQFKQAIIKELNL